MMSEGSQERNDYDTRVQSVPVRSLLSLQQRGALVLDSDGTWESHQRQQVHYAWSCYENPLIGLRVSVRHMS